MSLKYEPSSEPLHTLPRQSPGWCISACPTNTTPALSNRCVAHVRQSRHWLESGLGFQVKVLKNFDVFASSLGSGESIRRQQTRLCKRSCFGLSRLPKERARFMSTTQQPRLRCLFSKTVHICFPKPSLGCCMATCFPKPCISCRSTFLLLLYYSPA